MMAPGCFTHAADRKLAIILWDIENVRLPMPPGPTPAAVLMALKQRFVFSAGFVEHKTVCCVTRTSLHAIERSWPRFAGDVVPHMDVCIGSHTTTKFAADYVLCRELSSFMREQAAHAGRCRIVLLTGDADFTEPIQRAVRMGFDVQLVHYGESTACTLLELPVTRVEWTHFVSDMDTDVVPVFPYGAVLDDIRASAGAAREAVQASARAAQAELSAAKSALSATNTLLATVRREAAAEGMRVKAMLGAVRADAAAAAKRHEKRVMNAMKAESEAHAGAALVFVELEAARAELAALRGHATESPTVHTAMDVANEELHAAAAENRCWRVCGLLAAVPIGCALWRLSGCPP